MQKIKLFQDHPLPNININAGSKVLSPSWIVSGIAAEIPVSNDVYYFKNQFYNTQMASIKLETCHVNGLPMSITGFNGRDLSFLDYVFSYCKLIVRTAYTTYYPDNHRITCNMPDWGRSPEHVRAYNYDMKGLWVTCLLDVVDQQINYHCSLKDIRNVATLSPTIRFLKIIQPALTLLLGKLTLLFRDSIGPTNEISMDITYRHQTPSQPNQTVAPWRTYKLNSVTRTITLPTNAVTLLNDVKTAIARNSRTGVEAGIRAVLNVETVDGSTAQPTPVERRIDL
jgi:hypothetical protein